MDLALPHELRNPTKQKTFTGMIHCEYLLNRSHAALVNIGPVGLESTHLFQDINDAAV